MDVEWQARTGESSGVSSPRRGGNYVNELTKYLPRPRAIYAKRFGALTCRTPDPVMEGMRG